MEERRTEDLFEIDGQKMKYHVREVAKWTGESYVERSGFGPIYVEVSPVGYCNHRCSFCAVDWLGYKSTRIEGERLCALMEEMKVAGVKGVMFAGEGEPLLHRDLARVVQKAGEVGLDTSITTNGTMLDAKFARETLPWLSWVKVSLNAGDEKTYGRVHKGKKGDWGRVWCGVEEMLVERARLGKRKHQCAVGVQAVCLPDNAESLVELVRLADEVGVDYVVVKPYSHQGKSLTVRYKDVRYEKLEKELREIEKVERKRVRLVVRREAMRSWDAKGREYKKCCAVPYFWAYVASDGKVWGCSAHIGDANFLLGDVGEKKFGEIWYSEGRKGLDRYVREGLDIVECRKNCRMEKVNQYLWGVREGVEHQNFI